MRLVIDCFKLVKGQGKSLGIYNLTKSLIAHLAARNLAAAGAQAGAAEEAGGVGSTAENAGAGTPLHEIIVLGNEYNEKDFAVEGVTFRQMEGNPLSKAYDVLWELFLVKKWLKEEKADRVLFPRGYRPLWYQGKDTVIIHDLIPFYYDRHYYGVLNPVENAYIMARLRASMKHADRIITISEFSRLEIDAMCPGSGDRVRVIYNGVTPVASTGADCPFRPEGPYLYAVASGLPHKNAAGVLKTYEVYYRRCAERGEEPVQLVLTGVPGPESVAGNEDGQLLSSAAAAHVTCYKYIERAEDMYNLFAGAEAFLFLSLIEGFGFPPLEAMQVGVPVICSDRTALPEVVGDAALLTDPEDIGHTVDCIDRILTDEALREDLIRKGYENAKRFDWESRTDQYWEELLG